MGLIPGLDIYTGIMGYEGAQEAASAQKAAYMYNARVAMNNSKAAAMKAQLAGEAGAAQAQIKGMQGKATLGQITANQGASGLDVNTGSAVATRASARELSMIDTQTVRSNASREAYGYQIQKANFLGEAGLEQFEGQQAHVAGEYNAWGSLLGGFGNAMNDYMKYAMIGDY